MLSPALIISRTKGFVGGVYTIGSSVTVAHRYRFNRIRSGTASDETTASGALPACRTTRPCRVVPRPRQPKKAAQMHLHVQQSRFPRAVHVDKCRTAILDDFFLQIRPQSTAQQSFKKTFVSIPIHPRTQTPLEILSVF